MNEMIERCTVALKASIEGSPHNFGEAGIARVYEDGVRAVIAAMREPTEAMLDAPWRHPGIQVYEPTDLTQVLDCIPFAEIWKAMIDKALDED